MQNKNLISYSQCWEDTDLLLSALEVEEDDKIVSITSGGDNTLALLGQKPEKVYAVDINKAQNHLIELKFIAIQTFDYNVLLEFFGIKKSNTRVSTYKSLKHLLSESCCEFWDNNLNLLEKGIIHSGKFEKYFNYFKKYILAFTHSKQKINNLFIEKEAKEQQKYYNKEWDNWRWRLLYNFFFSKSIMSALGRSPKMFQFAGKTKISEHYLGKTKTALCNTTAFNNPYLEYIFKGNFYQNYPFYLQLDSINRIKTTNDKLEIFTNDLLSFLKKYPDNFFTKFNLSDVFEPLSEEETNLIFEEIVRVSKNSARIIFWNNLVKRDIPDNLSVYFNKEILKEKELIKIDKVFFYECFNIYKIRK